MEEGMTLLEITGQESGIVVWEDGTAMVVNWRNMDGLPRILGVLFEVVLPGTLSLKSRPEPTDDDLRMIRDYEQEHDGKEVSGIEGIRVYEVEELETGDRVRVITSDEWN